ncbi:MAG: 4Fe-4S binding protein [Bacteroidales bacterium]|nr:4Fe-4S binding protein [Bacteroidales bacterium]
MKVKRNIIKINEELCNGCGLCAKGCHEGALQIIDGKARLISELYCDGLGACIGDCPMNAISVEEKEVEAYDEIAVIKRIIPKGAKVLEAHLQHLKNHGEMNLLQQGIQYLKDNDIPVPALTQPQPQNVIPVSQLSAFKPMSVSINWPVQLHLINPQSGVFNNADLLLVADCVAYANPKLYSELLVGKKLAIACPKLDVNKESYVNKLIQMIDDSKINSLTVAIMEVPCCGGLIRLVEMAMEKSQRKIPMTKVVVKIRN